MYPRKCSILIGSNNLDLSVLRCRFQINAYQVGDAGMAYCRVTNHAKSTAAPLLVQANMPFQISAGYEDGPYGVIFKGQTTQVIDGRETPTDTMLTIVAHDAGYEKTAAAVNTTIPAGSTPKDHVNAAVKSMGGNVSQGYIGPDLSTPKYPRAVTLYAMASEILEKVARMKGATWSIQQGKMQMIAQANDSLPGGPVKLNSLTGMIGMPTQEIGGILARSLINPNIKIGGQVEINQASITQALGQIDPVTGQLQYQNGASNPFLPDITADGVYVVFAMDIIGDTRGDPWYMDIRCSKASQVAGLAPLGNFPKPNSIQ